MIEVMEFYPNNDKKIDPLIIGSLKIKLIESGIYLLGINVIKNKKFWFFNMPGRFGFHHETGIRIRYPFFCFDDRDKQVKLISEIREKGRAFVEKWLYENSPIIPIKPKHKKPKPKIVEREKISLEPKKPAMKVYVDPPPMKKKNIKRKNFLENIPNKI